MKKFSRFILAEPQLVRFGALSAILGQSLLPLLMGPIAGSDLRNGVIVAALIVFVWTLRSAEASEEGSPK